MLLIIASTAFFASILTFYSGFGLGTLLMPVIAIFFSLTTAIALTAVVHLANNLFKLFILWREVDWLITTKFGIPALLAAIPGAWLLANLANEKVLFTYQLFNLDFIITPIKLTIGLLLIIFAIIEWFSIASQFNFTKKHMVWGGALSGFFGGLSGHQGAFRSGFLLHANLSARQFIATNAVIASLVDVMRLVIYGLNITLITANIAPSLIATTTIAALAGVFIGKIYIQKITITLIQKLVAIMLLTIGILLSVGAI